MIEIGFDLVEFNFSGLEVLLGSERRNVEGLWPVLTFSEQRIGVVLGELRMVFFFDSCSRRCFYCFFFSSIEKCDADGTRSML